MSFFAVMGAIIAAGASITAFFFRKGGIYDQNDPHETPVKPLQHDLPQEIVSTAVQTKTSPLIAFCEAIRDYEGGPGDASYRNNNPGNCRCSLVGYLPKYGKVGCSPAGFAIFATYELGWEYLQALVHQRAVLHPAWTFADFFVNYSPTADGNSPTAYAAYVAHRCGVPVNSTLRQYFAMS